MRRRNNILLTEIERLENEYNLMKEKVMKNIPTPQKGYRPDSSKNRQDNMDYLKQNKRNSVNKSPSPDKKKIEKTNRSLNSPFKKHKTNAKI